ncbi:Acetyltransferase [Burkholderiales bacterium]|nr:Acetyltransferase [Burkholderiales bacterium]
MKRRQGRTRGPTPEPWLQTLRLDLREFVPGDVEDIVRLDGDPRVMKYIGTGRTHTREESIASFPRALRYPSLYANLGVWRASRRDSGAFVGWFSLKYAGAACDIEIGYRLLPDAWGQGFATEGAAALRDYGFDDVGLERIIGITHPGNRASQRVLAKIGMADEGWGHYYGHRVRLFAIESGVRDDFRPGRVEGAGDRVAKRRS